MGGPGGQGRASTYWACRLLFLEGELLLCLESVSGETITADGEAGDGRAAGSPGQLEASRKTAFRLFFSRFSRLYAVHYAAPPGLLYPLMHWGISRFFTSYFAEESSKSEIVPVYGKFLLAAKSYGVDVGVIKTEEKIDDDTSRGSVVAARELL